MNDSTKIALAVLGGYALGRRKKAKMALLLGSALVGKRLDMRALGKEVVGRLAESPEVGRIVGDVRGEMVSTGRAAAMAVLSRPLENLADRLEERTSGLTGAPSKGRREDEDEEDEYEERAEDQEEEEEPERGRAEDQEEDEEEEQPRRRSRAAADRDRGDDSDRRRAAPARGRRSAPPRQRERDESRTPSSTGRRGASRG
ncbi:hypothetical protein [Actinopolymorpha pittospori]|uniref:DNA primase n=1 Tax=Actinopolymorpha pittospori TaxID=648752 RepID=A0A927RCJ4_9ACTN|nr:hypothetical protein [Actinopolymorpha pittospori]MBE1607170.1 hypothetical protein [Actinopolymorpha pittospori]